MDFKGVTVWVHDNNFSKEEVLIAPDIFGDDALPPNALMEIVELKLSSDLQDPQRSAPEVSQISRNTSIHSASVVLKESTGQRAHSEHWKASPKVFGQNGTLEADPCTRYFFVAKPMPPDIRAKHPKLQVSITSSIASTFGYRQRAQAAIYLADHRACSASHVELIFHDEYLSRSDMWRLVRSDLAGKTVYKGQKILFLGTIKATVRAIYVRGRTLSSAYFGKATCPVFRSESARYVLFIQMSREMWNFDSEGTGEILFSRVIDGFLPELFKKWVELEARHLVSIVLFSRLEYDCHALTALQRLNSDRSDGPSIDIDETAAYRDFYRVVVTDMASGQWTTILNELKKDFRTFLRDITLHQPREVSFAREDSAAELEKGSRTRICGRPTNALRGNILEAINIASSQFAGDYIDRDLVRTGVCVIVITPGTGGFEVDRQLLNQTSENLTNNGIGIDLVCLSKIPLHSVPLFKWLKSPLGMGTISSNITLPVPSSDSFSRTSSNARVRYQDSLSFSGTLDDAQWSFGIPKWIDISYWTPTEWQSQGNHRRERRQTAQLYRNRMYPKKFVPRVRMYELQMMGVMELGLASISVPYLAERRQNDSKHHEFSATQSENFNTSSRTKLTSRASGSAYSLYRGRGLLSVQAKQLGDMYERMDAYDRNVFSLNTRPEVADPAVRRKKTKRRVLSFKENARWQTSNSLWRANESMNTSGTDVTKPEHRMQKGKAAASSLHGKSATDSRISRSTSFALRGLGPSAPRATASTEINIENVQAKQPVSNRTSYRALGDSSRIPGSPAKSKSGRLSALSEDSQCSESSDSNRPAQEAETYPSTPISIRDSAKQDQHFGHWPKSEVVSAVRRTSTQKGDQTTDDESTSESSEVSEPYLGDKVPSPEITSDISPWILNVNPANPSRNHLTAASCFGRWRYHYPRPPKILTVKWKSLCTPASVPLTTEDFPSKSDLEQLYMQTSYVVSQSENNELTEALRGRDWLLQEMIGLRLSHGYQLVVGKRVAKAIEVGTAELVDYYTPGRLARDGVAVFMSMDNTIQKLFCANGAEVHVTQFIRNTVEAAQKTTQPTKYSPVIRTVFSKSYIFHPMTLASFSREYSWSLADSYIAGRQDDLTKVYEQLRFWRARFVVIPVEPPPSARRPTQSRSEDNEEEIHLLGIHELTKMWQRTRYTPREEGRFKPTIGKRKDPNPLEIMYQTLNPSAVVATEIEKLLATDEATESKQIQLLPDSELLERSTTSLSRIAQVLQSDKGVEIANRIWHLRLHYSCFKGDDFTNWLMSSFKDIDSREEAVDFGNELMQHGLFHHVSTRHTFKDGNYFYTIAQEHRVPRPESRSSWFYGGRRSDRSMPATPVAESGSHVSPLSIVSQSSENSARSVQTRATGKCSGEKRQLSVFLTKMMQIDVDHRHPKRSERPEIVNLHYDRLHNPENCYHLELSWLNVTSKLVEDAIVTWATLLEKYGLRLVEVPIAEACSITDREPFRAPYRIVLKVPPPASGNVMVSSGTTYSMNTSLAVQTAPSADKLIYQKALLKKFNFVLDLEAASEFPPDVDVRYTWGKLGYRYPQFVHRSGVVLAQITDEGDLYLLANRLYNTRSAPAKDFVGKFEKNSSHHRSTPVSGIVGLNAQNPSPDPSPLVRASSDVLGSRNALNASGMATFITPEQIKDDLESFCHNATKLQAFYKDISEERGPSTGRKSASTSSSGLQPAPGYGLDSSIPELRLPASVVTTTTAAGKIQLKKKTSPQPAGRERAGPETVNTDSSRKTSAGSQ